MLKGFREFIARGNDIDLAVGIVTGAAFATAIPAKLPADSVDFAHGASLNAVIAFGLTAAAIYYLAAVPMNRWAQRCGLRPTEIGDRVPNTKAR
ncbi:MscL family protein [Allorhizocola rhizosphaerae]|uniref:MscL family protein n=1 Tax=Allorhizocola rhizosphaerae TaxID=1872709 RepID=UPI000E3E1871|nr:MscL family protein [Allorhizocola rhizosphaerae]